MELLAVLCYSSLMKQNQLLQNDRLITRAALAPDSKRQAAEAAPPAAVSGRRRGWEPSRTTNWVVPAGLSCIASSVLESSL
jgi:hypothetical protein